MTAQAGGVLVTGGASGIGAAIVAALQRAGRQVAVADLAPAPAAELFIPTDVSDPTACEGAVAAAERAFGLLTEVYLNAGLATGDASGIEEVTLERYRVLVGVNVDGVVFGTRAALPALRRAGGGTIVATASLAGLVPMPLDSVYTLTKHAVVGFVRSVASELAASKVRIAALCPGFTETPLLDPFVERFRDTAFPLLQPGEVAAAALLAAQGESGACWTVQPGRPPEPYRFRGVPAARTTEGLSAEVPY
ncbi:MAG: SDR family oxidoreductase [Mycobacteriales bacterium]